MTIKSTLQYHPYISRVEAKLQDSEFKRTMREKEQAYCLIAESYGLSHRAAADIIIRKRLEDTEAAILIWEHHARVTNAQQG